MIKTKKGFTLIELLVVIAIIGILSSVVLASLNTARAKGSDAAIKSQLASMRAQAEIYNDTNGNYGAAFAAGACAATAGTLFADPNITAQITAAGNASNGGGIGRGTCVATAAPSAWAISVPLKSSGAWCVDSTGASRNSTSAGVLYTGSGPGASPAAITAGTAACN